MVTRRHENQQWLVFVYSRRIAEDSANTVVMGSNFMVRMGERI
jgi:hypothetical protein